MSHPDDDDARILEGIVTTLDAAGALNVAPMGPRIAGDRWDTFVLRPFRTSSTYRNLKAAGEGVLHVTDDVLLLARTAIGRPAEAETRPAAVVRGSILAGACRYHEFRVATLDDREDRATIEAVTVASGELRPFFGLNRAMAAVVEAAILATRLGLLPAAEILDAYRRLAVPVAKTGGARERAAFELLESHVRSRLPGGAGPGADAPSHERA
jgi:hypothetical protein